MKIAILGAGGLLGSAFVRRLSGTDNEVVAWRKEDLDITDFLSLKEKLFGFDPDYIINAAGYTNLVNCENNLNVAKAVNGFAVRSLAEIAFDMGATLVHFSASSVFSGQNKSGYAEDTTEFSPLNQYGYTKALGESGISDIQDWTGNHLKYYLIRSAKLFGGERDNWAKSLFERLGSGGRQVLAEGGWGAVTYVPDLVDTVLDLLEQNYDYGIYHIVNGELCSDMEVAREILKRRRVSVEVKLQASERQLPDYPYLLNQKLPALRSWREAVDEYLVQL